MTSPADHAATELKILAQAIKESVADGKCKNQAYAAVERLVALADRATELERKWQAAVSGEFIANERAERAETALREISEQQPKTIDWLRANGIVFDGPLGADPDNWEHVAFSIYTDLCEMDSIAHAALGETHDV